MHESALGWSSPTMGAIAELTRDSVFLLDRERRITHINRTAEGLTVEEAVGTIIFDLLTTEQAEVARVAFRQAEQTGNKTSYEITYPLPDGRLSRWLSHIGPQSDGSFVVVSSDVTEHVSARDELDLLFALSRDLLFVTGYDGKYQRVSPAAVDTLGYSLEVLTSRPFIEFIHPNDRAETLEVFHRMLEEGSDVVLFENRYITQDGRYRLLQWTARPDPASRRVVAVARDVTEARALEQQLRQSQKMDAVGQLAGGMAHDFNNLLQAIFGAVDLANQAKPTGAVASCLQDVETASERAAELVRQLLAFSTHHPVASAPVDVNELVRASAKLLRRVLPATIELHALEAEQPQMVVADRAQIEQALLNLCLNARDAMREPIVIMNHLEQVFAEFT